MTRSHTAILAGVTILAIMGFFIPVFAHDGHVKASGASFDPNAPKKFLRPPQAQSNSRPRKLISVRSRMSCG